MRLFDTLQDLLLISCNAREIHAYDIDNEFTTYDAVSLDRAYEHS